MNIKLSKEEKSYLEQYCTRMGRTKTDVLRELIRGLPGESSGWGDVDHEESLLEVLPEGWERHDANGKLAKLGGSYRKLWCDIYYLTLGGFEIWFDGDVRGFSSVTSQPLLVITYAQALIDDYLEVQGVSC